MNKNIFSTWICIDDENNSSYFPSAGGKSSNKYIQYGYWRCLLVCLFSARLNNPKIRLIVFSNITDLPYIDGIDFQIVFKKLQIEFHVTPFEYQTPVGYYGEWKNQFYEFSILKYIANSHLFTDSDKFIMVDSDCIVTKCLDSLFNHIEEYGSINYEISYGENIKINGNSRLDMKQIFERIDNTTLSIVPNYYGGEFFAAKVANIKNISNTFFTLWPKLMEMNENNLPRLHEEAHILSYIYYKLGYDNKVANKYIKRLWTDPTTYRNVTSEDVSLLIWHLPAEKRHGFKKMFKILSSRNFEIYKTNPKEFLKISSKIFMIPTINNLNKIFFLIKFLIKKVITI